MKRIDTGRSARTPRNLAAEATFGSYDADSEGATRRPSLKSGRINRSHMTFALVPLVLLGITCGFSAVHRAAAAIIHPHIGGSYTGRMSPDAASSYANDLCSKFTGTTVTIKDISEQTAYSWRRHTVVREWNVLCDSSRGEYLLRINADTERVYAINRMDIPTVASQIATEDESGPLTRSEAEQRARQYLKMIGMPIDNLKPLNDGEQTKPDITSPQSIPQWNFTYRHHVTGLGDRLLKVSVNGANGGLEHVWNPVSAM